MFSRASGLSWSRFAQLIGIIAVVVWMSMSVLWFEYANTRPSVMNLSEGRVYSLITHGSVVYLTWAEELRLDSLIVTGLTLALISISIHLRFMRK